MTNLIPAIPAIVLTTLMTNAPTTNWPYPSGKQIDVSTMVLRQDVISYTNNGVPVLWTNYYRHLEMKKTFILNEEWIEAPLPLIPASIVHPPPLPHR